MNIGFYLSQSRHGLSLYLYAATMIDALRQYDQRHRYCLFYCYDDYPSSVNEDARWTVVSAEHRTLYPGGKGWLARQRERTLRKLAVYGLVDPASVCIRPTLRRLFDRFDIGLMIYPNMDSTSFEAGIPYIITISDLWFKIQPDFARMSGDLRGLEYAARYGCQYAQVVITDSEPGKDDLVRFYSVPPDQVVVAPFVPPTLIAQGGTSEDDLERVRRAYQLPADYVFYPASLRPEKNHERLVEALHLIGERYGATIPCVLVGPKAGAYDGLAALIQTLGMSRQVHYLGHVPNEDMAPLYRMALMLVMPTFIGPTNLPVVEAWSQGCPVISSDIRGIREQVGDAGLLADPRSAEELATAIYRVYSDTGLRQALVARGAERCSQYTFENYAQILVSTVQTVVDGLKVS